MLLGSWVSNVGWHGLRTVFQLLLVNTGTDRSICICSQENVFVNSTFALADMVLFNNGAQVGTEYIILNSTIFSFFFFHCAEVHCI